MIIQPANRIDRVDSYYFAQKLREIREMQSRGIDVINLGIGNPDLPPPECVQARARGTLSSSGANQYQPYRGLPALRSALATWYQDTFAVSLDPSTEILPLLGSKEGVFYLSMAFLEPGDQVLVPDPGYAAYTSAALLAGAEPTPYDLHEQNQWLPNLKSLYDLDTRRVKIMWLNYPHMPSGVSATRTLYDALIRFALERDILLCVDNPYSLVNNSEKPLSILYSNQARRCAVELNSLSKSHHMAGWRIGMLLGHEQYVNTVLRIKSNVDSGMFKPVQEAAISALQTDSSWRRSQDDIYTERRHKVEHLLVKLGCKIRTPNQSGIFVWARIPRTDAGSEAFSDRILKTHQVFLTPGAVFGKNGNQHVRASLCADISRIEQATERIEHSMISV